MTSQRVEQSLKLHHSGHFVFPHNLNSVEITNENRQEGNKPIKYDSKSCKLFILRLDLSNVQFKVQDVTLHTYITFASQN